MEALPLPIESTPKESSLVLPLPLDLGPARILIELGWRTGDHLCIPCLTSVNRNLEEGHFVAAESFTAAVVADLLLGQRGYIKLVRSILQMLKGELTNDDVLFFFKDHTLLPADADCTAVAMSVLLRGGVPVQDRAHRALDRILRNVSEDGVVETYFDPTGERDGIIDPVVCCNVLFLAYTLGREHQAATTIDYVLNVLEDEAYDKGTRYYHSPDTFLYFLGRVLHHYPRAGHELWEPLCEALANRQGTTEFTLDLAQRVLLSKWLGVDDGGERKKLIALQQSEGAWPMDSLFRYGRKKVFFGSKVLTAAFAVAALAEDDSDGYMRA